MCEATVIGEHQGMIRENLLGNFEHLKRYLQDRSEAGIDDEDVFILATTLEEPLTMTEICYSTGLKQAICIARVRRLMEAGLLNRYDPKSPKGQKRGGMYVYQLPDDIARDLGALRLYEGTKAD
jgi:hypothetical protein